MAASPYPANKTCRPGKRSATGHGRPHDPTVKRSKNTKEGIYKRRKQKPSHRLGSLNSGARTRNRTKDTGIFNPFKKDQTIHQH
jgi:hypothetical protein